MDDKIVLDEPRFKTFPVRMSLQMNNILRSKAFNDGLTVHQLVLRAIAKEIAGAEEAV